VTGRWFSPRLPVSSTNKADRHDIAKLLLKVALNTIKLPLPPIKKTKKSNNNKKQNNNNKETERHD
jgi:hypothetical protein